MNLAVIFGVGIEAAIAGTMIERRYPDYKIFHLVFSEDWVTAPPLLDLVPLATPLPFALPDDAFSGYEILRQGPDENWAALRRAAGFLPYEEQWAKAERRQNRFVHGWIPEEFLRGYWQTRSSRIVQTPTDVAAKGAQVMADLVISTLPAEIWCIKPDEHIFVQSQIWVQDVSYPLVPGILELNSHDGPAWTARLRIKEHAQAIYLRRPPFDDVTGYQTPVKTTCDCTPSWVQLRLGAWATYNPLAASYREQIAAVDDIL